MSPSHRDGFGSGSDRITRTLIVLFCWGVAVLLTLHFLRPLAFVALGFLAAVSVAAFLRPAMRFIPGPRPLGATVLGVGFFAVVAGLLTTLSYFLTKPIKRELRYWPETRQSLDQMLTRWSERFGLEKPVTLDGLLEQGAGFVTDGGTQLFGRLSGFLSALAVVAAFLFFGAVYLLAEKPGHLSRGTAALLPERRRPQLLAAIEALDPRLRWWMLGTFFTMTVTGAASWIGYRLVGLKFALAIGLFSGLAEIVPTLGPLIAFAVALLVAATQGGDVVIGVVIVYAILQTIESYILLPLVMKEAVRIPPVVTLFSVVLWGKLLGLGGLLMSIPINLVIWSVVEQFVKRERPDGAKPARSGS